jgi:choline dehydrogenase-like flavoprotein
MSESKVAIVGSGIVGTAIAFALSKKGHNVVIFEKGPEFPYPHQAQFRDQVMYLYTDNPAYTLPRDLKNVTLSGDYGKVHLDIGGEMGTVVGGSATHWGGVSLRMHPSDFQLRTKYGRGTDWPIDYQTIEPYYCRAESMIGVSGTDEDNPFAPPRSQPFPLPPFQLSWDDQILADLLRHDGITLHTTPQARVRNGYDGRPGCMNFGVCPTCPIGARYSPNHHLQQAIATGHARVLPNVSVRRIVLDENGRARALVYRRNDSSKDEEHAASVIIVAAGAIESARLLLLSRDSHRPDGVGNHAGDVGKNLTFHHYYVTELRYDRALYPGRLGPQTGQSQQFVDPTTRAKNGGIKIDFHSWPSLANPWERTSGKEILEDFEVMKRARTLGLHCESTPSAIKLVRLSEEKDRFGDPFAHLHYDLADIDFETHGFGRTLFDRFVRATKATDARFEDDPIVFSSGAHHMGTCRMGSDPKSSVVDPQLRVHGSPNLFVVGGASFVGCSGAVHPTLTMTALAIRASDFILDQLLPNE